MQMNTEIDWNTPQAIAAKEHSAAVEDMNTARRIWLESTNARKSLAALAKYKEASQIESDLRAIWMSKFAR